jgi:hypothetical protein
MRRVAAVLMALGFSFAGFPAWGAGVWGAGPAWGAVAPAGHPASRMAPLVTIARAGMKVVAFAGYTIEVPAGWPVYRLARDPQRCVRYDRSAVYLGQPGANQQCPAHLAGRAATLSLAGAVYR